LLILLVLTGCTHIPYAAGPAADTPEGTRLSGEQLKTAAYYEQALLAWKTPEGISARTRRNLFTRMSNTESAESWLFGKSSPMKSSGALEP
jgi:hypothetical protein